MAKGLGVSEDKISIDYKTKLVTVDMDPDSFDKGVCAKALEAGGYGMANM